MRMRMRMRMIMSIMISSIDIEVIRTVCYYYYYYYYFQEEKYKHLKQNKSISSNFHTINIRNIYLDNTPKIKNNFHLHMIRLKNMHKDS